jgi:hypothetical protein
MAGTVPREIRVETTIRATAAAVWDHLIDLPGYARWNPFILKARGTIAPGARVTLLVRCHDGLKMVVRPRIVAVQPQQLLRWRGRLGIPGLVDGEHSFAIEPLTLGMVRLVQHESYRGLLVPLLWWRLKRDALHGFEAMNRALREVLEKRRPGGSA